MRCMPPPWMTASFVRRSGRRTARSSCSPR
jgi:hypothetical protein